MPNAPKYLIFFGYVCGCWHTYFSQFTVDFHKLGMSTVENPHQVLVVAVIVDIVLLAKVILALHPDAAV